jgi:hypothetical protein
VFAFPLHVLRASDFARLDTLPSFEQLLFTNTNGNASANGNCYGTCNGYANGYSNGHGNGYSNGYPTNSNGYPNTATGTAAPNPSLCASRPSGPLLSPGTTPTAGCNGFFLGGAGGGTSSGCLGYNRASSSTDLLALSAGGRGSGAAVDPVSGSYEQQPAGICSGSGGNGGAGSDRLHVVFEIAPDARDQFQSPARSKARLIFISHRTRWWWLLLVLVLVLAVVVLLLAAGCWLLLGLLAVAATCVCWPLL